MQVTGKQKEILPVWAVPKLMIADDAEVRLIRSDADAFRRMIERAPQARKAIEADLGKSTSHVSQIQGCTKGIMVDQLGDWLDCCQNVLYLQKLLWDRGCRVVRREWTVEDKAAAFDAMTNERAVVAQRSA